MPSRNKRIAFILAGVAGLALSLPAIGQRSPESLLPEGFGDSSPTPAPSPTPTPGSGPTPLLPPGPLATDTPAPDEELAGEETPEEEKEPPVELPDAARRPIDVVGPLTDENGGLGEGAFARVNGLFLSRLMRSIDAPVASRWGSIVLRRALLTRVPTPVDVDPADWIAERAWLLLRMGEADAARMLVESVDTDQLSPKLIVVAQQVALATSDPAALCRLNAGAAQFSKDKSWDYARAICASLSGEGAISSALLDQARGTGRRKIDFLLAEKVIGAGANTRRSAMIEWADVDRLTTWRFGLASSVGLVIPDTLYATVGPEVQAWRARSPMFHAEDRLGAAAIAATLGVFSNAALVDLYAQAADGEGDVGRDSPTARLRAAYVGDDDSARMSAIRDLWSGAEEKPGGLYGFEILTARAAARIKPSDSFSSDYAKLIASMLSAGLDVQAARWASLVEAEGKADDAWALLAVGLPRRSVTISGSKVDDYASRLGSDGAHKARLVIAALGGLGRITPAELASLAEDYDLPITQQNEYTRVLDRASARAEQGTVAVLAAAGMQTRDWKYVPPVYLYHIIAALKRTGNEPIARMIAAEAISRT
jgi:hypothetical protein